MKKEITAGIFVVVMLALGSAPIFASSKSTGTAQSAPPPRISSDGSIRTLWLNDGSSPQNLQELRLRDLESAAGISRYDWGMTVPAGRKLVIHLSGGRSGGEHPVFNDYVFAVNGPLASSFANRISLIRHMTNHDRTVQLAFEISAQGKNGIAMANPSFPEIEVDPGWVGDWGNTSGEMIGTIWETHLGTADAPDLFHYKLEISTAAADPTAKAGQIVTIHLQ